MARTSSTKPVEKVDEGVAEVKAPEVKAPKPASPKKVVTEVEVIAMQRTPKTYINGELVLPEMNPDSSDERKHSTVVSADKVKHLKNHRDIDGKMFFRFRDVK